MWFFARWNHSGRGKVTSASCDLIYSFVSLPFKKAHYSLIFIIKLIHFSNKQLQLVSMQLILWYPVKVNNKKKSRCRNFLFYFSRANKVTGTHFTDPLILNSTTNQTQGMCWTSQKRQEDLLKNECFLQAALYLRWGDTDDVTAQRDWHIIRFSFFPLQINTQKVTSDDLLKMYF